MGFNISGLVVNKNYQDNINELFDKLGWSLTKGEEIDFETASSNWQEEEYCDVYFSERGTLVFLNIDYCTDGYPIENLNTLTFGYSETSMAFLLNYCENGIETRSIMETEGEIFFNEGEKLEIENNCDNISDVIWKQIEIVLGKSFHEIENSETATRFYFSNELKTELEQTIELEQKENSNEVNKITEELPNKYNFELRINKGVFSSEYSDKDLLEKFDEQIDFAKTNRINIYFYPWSHGENLSRFMNFFALIEEIKNRPHVLDKVCKAFPKKEHFNALCKCNPDDLNEKETKEMIIKLVDSIRPISRNDNYIPEKKIEKKWWEFWK